ncbi:hypothetical protein [Candidatus Magnetominusculus dajiuhuensis]|uniref:hypothetical protein n=1 Tax=Candidatus Magnetominusculus dajiuhuensis TaxID=3137712 RepID=UPI003B43663A
MPELKDKLELKDIVLLGRTFDEYFRAFNLQDIDLKNAKILDAASGVSSFCAEAALQGFNVTGSDRIYSLSAPTIESRCAQDLELVMAQMPGVSHLYNWEYFKDVESLKAARQRAYKLFVGDFQRQGHRRYITCEYPHTDFSNNQFSITLISHFLFLYDGRLDYEFHRETIKECMRITSKEIRIFPIVNLEGEQSPYVEKILNDEAFFDCTKDIQAVDYNFIRNGNRVLVISV